MRGIGGSPYGKNEIHLIDRLSPPSAKYLLGTDQLGRDIFSRLLYGISIDVLTGLACAAVVSIVAAGWGMLAAYCRKMNNWIGDTLEDLVMLPREIACALPWLALILLIMCLWQNSSIVMFGVVCGLVMLPRAAGSRRPREWCRRLTSQRRMERTGCRACCGRCRWYFYLRRPESLFIFRQ